LIVYGDEWWWLMVVVVCRDNEVVENDGDCGL
jgi:hypothetical protein